MLNPFDAPFRARLAALLPEGTLREAAPRHLAEPRGRWQGRPGPLAAPRTTEDVATILGACNAARVGVVPWGGGTGLVSGQVMPDGPLPLILSLERMTALRGLWPGENVIAVEAGMTLAAVQDTARQAGRLFPLSLASEGTATIGGNLATNAGGTQVLRYGTARELCLGIEAVFADGRVMRGLKRLRKDNTGYDLRDLILGSEGTLAVITAASLRLYAPPAQRLVALMAVPSPAAAQGLLALCEDRAGGLVSGFELISRMGFDFLAETGHDIRPPFDPLPDWMVLMELGLPPLMDGPATMAGIYDEAARAGLALDGVIAQSEAQADQLWAMREAIPEGNRRIGSISSHDISLPLGAIPDFIAAAGERLRAMADIRINCFGHLGDGNLHFNLFPARGHGRGDYAPLAAALSDAVHEMVAAYDGSISAEHGIGRLKTADLARYGDPARLAMMRAVKAALDPAGILNPGAVLPL
ncbi:FAD-binding oxidoreductase [Pseudogemmobacter humi]|uniref:Putative FAD-linked oxidoreductase n=1 Tax=Pseudogemmobacter humi TaxID=2483812 RepID=A0A3P5X2D4_9RHOB|nr:FAD-binding oxidoreductase [Pseudogemmobacter humi]VDC28300.1 putative FAD-linked oxidoreductase [Pseudogemmobacter humi]